MQNTNGSVHNLLTYITAVAAPGKKGPASVPRHVTRVVRPGELSAAVALFGVEGSQYTPQVRYRSNGNRSSRRCFWALVIDLLTLLQEQLTTIDSSGYQTICVLACRREDPPCTRICGWLYAIPIRAPLEYTLDRDWVAFVGSIWINVVHF